MKRAPLAALALAGCSVSNEPPSSQPVFDPVAFFAGRTHGEGIIDPLIGAQSRLRVDSVGHVDRGGILLVQRIEEGTKPARIRRWRLKPVAPGRYGGWLTDAEGRISAETEGNRLAIQYRTPGGLDFEQQLTLRPDRRTVRNRMTIRKWGVPVAHVTERITKVD